MVENIHPLLRDVSLRILCPTHEYTPTSMLIQVATFYTLPLHVSLLPDLLPRAESLSQEFVGEACQQQERPDDTMWSIWLVCLQPRNMSICHFKDEDLGEVALHSLF